MPQAADKAVNISTRQPNLINMWNTLSIVCPFINNGSELAINVLITSVMLDSNRPSKLAVPWSLGDIAPSSDRRVRDTLAGLSFPLDGLFVGETHMVTVKGTYEYNAVTHDFTLDIPINVPLPDPRQGALPKPMAARVQVAVDEKAGLWTYTLINEEGASDTQFIHVFNLPMAAPFTVRGTPKGWSVQTDNKTFVLWHVNPSTGHDIAPGASLAGFQIQSASKTSEGKAYSIHSWNHKTDRSDLVGLGTVLTPARQR